MPEDRRSQDHRAQEPPTLSPVERRVMRSLDGEDRRGRRIPNEELLRERTVESYLRGAVMPRWMERLKEIHRGMDEHRRALAEAYAQEREDHAEDPEGFADAWRRRVARHSFEDVNDLIRDHNQWYPVERQLPMDPRTGEYVLIAGRPYMREELTDEWALARFPPVLGDDAAPES
ncbi:MAG TPA: hypothetical protein VK501_07255 [Baekduia sp.]|uniref:hypothetical protein n=1 Tax=Baekduia sp. TaxID=2600305 RepID=UPI002C4DB289|nr:hypothetical protein [Baekduia sp.]HMJ33699.1 hypothetical protein [Baekduia sp.]